MDRFELINIFKAVLKQRELESNEGECLVDSADTSTCSGEVCGVSWKPMPDKNDVGEDLG